MTPCMSAFLVINAVVGRDAQAEDCSGQSSSSSLPLWEALLPFLPTSLTFTQSSTSLMSTSASPLAGLNDATIFTEDRMKLAGCICTAVIGESQTM